MLGGNTNHWASRHGGSTETIDPESFTFMVLEIEVADMNGDKIVLRQPIHIHKAAKWSTLFDRLTSRYVYHFEANSTS